MANGTRKRLASPREDKENVNLLQRRHVVDEESEE